MAEARRAHVTAMEAYHAGMKQAERRQDTLQRRIDGTLDDVALINQRIHELEMGGATPGTPTASSRSLTSGGSSRSHGGGSAKKRAVPPPRPPPGGPRPPTTPRPAGGAGAAGAGADAGVYAHARVRVWVWVWVWVRR